MKFISNILKKIGGDPLARYWKIVEEINAKEEYFESLSEKELKEKSDEFKNILRNKEKTKDDLIPDTFALVREIAKRNLNERHYDVQLIAGITLHEGKVAEMLTGEGKTLSSTLPVYLNALDGSGVHIVTVNDYLAKRDAVWMGQIYHALDLKVACLVHDGALIYDPSYMPEERLEELDKERDLLGSFKVVDEFLRPISRKEAYKADIVYGTNHQFGFDYLRDNLVLDLDDRVQRGFNYVIIDEVDSILIDEARTPLIISAPNEQSSDFYKTFSNIANRLKEGKDYDVDEKHKSVDLTDEGIEKAEKMANIDNIYSPENSKLVHYLDESLKAKGLFKKDKDYVVKDNEIILVDQFTGRLMPGRRYSGGLHQAIEAKEGLSVRKENRTMAQITIQNYFKFYDKLSGMTGTAESSAEEFNKVYDLDVVSIPPNRPVVRDDMDDVIYKNKDAKYRAVARDVKKRIEKGQPVLLGTTSIENNEEISNYLRKENIPHEVLNAKNNEREGEIIAQAGKVGAATVATNMAGRGVDIILGGKPKDEKEYEKVKGFGGLHVIGTERHEARRIDNQLRGRSGRQGDSGSSQFFLSLEDDLLRVFGGDRIQRFMESFKISEDEPIEAKIISKAVNQAQQKVEGMNLDMRKHLLDYDDVLNRQRTSIYERRERYIKEGNNNKILDSLKKVLNNFYEDIKKRTEEEIIELKRNKADREEIKSRKDFVKELEEKINIIPNEIEEKKSKIISRHMVRIIDSLWVEHLDGLQSLRQSVNIRAYGQKEPIVEYRREAHSLFKKLNFNFQSLLYKTAFKILEMDPNEINIVKKADKPTPPPSGEKIGRNDPCWCGSGKKYKRCHGK
ncbi:MAG: preprotein translocase subunit SecA [Candidatus Paceibacterota bacterium]